MYNTEYPIDIMNEINNIESQLKLSEQTKKIIEYFITEANRAYLLGYENGLKNSLK